MGMSPSSPFAAKDPCGNKLPFLAVRRKPSGAAKPEGLRPTASFNPVIYFRAAPNNRQLRIADTAHVHLTTLKPRSGLALLNGHR